MPPARYPSLQRPQYPRGRGHRSLESRAHSPTYFDQKVSCGEKGQGQRPSAHV